MKLTFLGTRGYIDIRSDRHAMHSALLVSYRGRRVMVDCGADWLDRFQPLRPHAIVLTHAHPDHAHGLKHGAPCPVYATDVTWRDLERFPVADRRTLEPGKPAVVAGITFLPIPVAHSLRCPAVCYRISAGRPSIVYAPDVAYIPDRRRAMAGARLYIGDGASLARPLIRRQAGQLFGHASVQTQLTWCSKEGVAHAVITHCGREVVAADEQAILTRLNQAAAKRGVTAQLAHDGMSMILR